MYCLCDDKKVVGAAFYVMEYVQGRIFTDVRMKNLGQEERWTCWRSAIDTLTRLSTIPLSALQLPASFAPSPSQKPYFPRQVKSLLRVSDAQSEARSEQTGEQLGHIWGTKEMGPWFEKGAHLIAAQENQSRIGSVVHGDFKIDNLVSSINCRQSYRSLTTVCKIFHPSESRVIGILDWELCTLGSPLADLGNVLLPFSFPPISPEQRQALSSKLDGKDKEDLNLLLGLKGVSSEETGIPQREELEKWWVDGMIRGSEYHGNKQAVWKWPISGME